MYMTDEQRYSAVLKELGEVLQSKNTTISCQKWQIDQLKEKLAAAEEERAEACSKENAQGDGKTYWLLDKEAIDTLCSVNIMLRKCYNNMSKEAGCAEYVHTLTVVQETLAAILPIKEGAA